MEQVLELLKNNYEWFFSGFGVFLLSFFLIKKSKGQKQKIGNNSIGVQAGRDVNINKSK